VFIGGIAMPIPAELKLTYEDYLNLPNDGKRHEIIDGEHYMTPSPQSRHQLICGNLVGILVAYAREADHGHVYPAPMDVVLSETDVVQPDILFVRRERKHIIKKNCIEGAPDLAIEILSPGGERLDRHTKMKSYALHGVPEYWLVDFEARTLEQYALRGHLYERLGVFVEAFSPSLFPGLTIDLRLVFKGPGF
jgi:Uma2 family endonuclease